MTVPLMDPHSQYDAVRPQIARAIADVIDSGRFILGPRVADVERVFAEQVGAAHGIGVANGTDALLIALRALGIQPGDEVICPSFTFYATAESIAAVGAVPVFADIEEETYCLDPAAVEAALTPRTRAVMPVHLFGHPAPIGPLRAICVKHDLALLEDAAQAYGASLDGVRCGALGDAATFSFFPTKNLPCFGDGGLITTSSADVDRASRVLRFHGSEDKKTFTEVGYNSRLDELQAAILLELRPHVDGWNDDRIAVAARYEELGLGEHVVLPAVAPGARHVYHLYIVRSQDRDRLASGLGEAGVGNAVYYSTPLHRQPVFEHLGYPEGSLPVTERCARECMALPMSPTLGEAAQGEVVQAVRALSPART
jgi:dTDP-3-amino-3,4,6-trideoxy-alpha-D-glucose transaminase